MNSPVTATTGSTSKYDAVVYTELGARRYGRGSITRLEFFFRESHYLQCFYILLYKHLSSSFTSLCIGHIVVAI